ncbi:MAG TPA: integrase core domain-containing protein, partial [Ktedonobacterales bacterium]
HPASNDDLWQLDFQGHLPVTTPSGTRCHPLTVLDDHSRFALGIVACADEQTATVQAALTSLVRQYGLPRRLLCDNGAPWGAGGSALPWTPLVIWLARLGIAVSHGRPYHPQTQGKAERFHRSLRAEALTAPLTDLSHAQQVFDTWRQVYNHERPHEALDGAVPASCYQPRPRLLPDSLPPIVYDATCTVRIVQQHGVIHWQGHRYHLSKAFVGLPVGLRPSDEAGCWAVYFLDYCLASLDTRTHGVYPVTNVPRS